MTLHLTSLTDTRRHMRPLDHCRPAIACNRPIMTDPSRSDGRAARVNFDGAKVLNDKRRRRYPRSDVATRNPENALLVIK